MSLTTNMTVTLIDTATTLLQMLTDLKPLPTNQPSLYIDAEGRDLSRNGTLALLQIYASPHRQTYLIDIHVLQQSAFSTTLPCGTSLKSILESDAIPKVIFDVRSDSDALYHLYQVKLAGIIDLQLMEFATRRQPGPYLSGLARCIRMDARLSPSAYTRWNAVKENGKKLFAPEKGGSYEVFHQRPLADALIEYSAGDVDILPKLYEIYAGKMGGEVRGMMLQESGRRVEESLSATCCAKGKERAIGPAVLRGLAQKTTAGVGSLGLRFG